MKIYSSKIVGGFIVLHLLSITGSFASDHSFREFWGESETVDEPIEVPEPIEDETDSDDFDGLRADLGF